MGFSALTLNTVSPHRFPHYGNRWILTAASTHWKEYQHIFAKIRDEKEETPLNEPEDVSCAWELKKGLYIASIFMIFNSWHSVNPQVRNPPLQRGPTPCLHRIKPYKEWMSAPETIHRIFEIRGRPASISSVNGSIWKWSWLERKERRPKVWNVEWKTFCHNDIPYTLHSSQSFSQNWRSGIRDDISLSWTASCGFFGGFGRNRWRRAWRLRGARELQRRHCKFVKSSFRREIWMEYIESPILVPLYCYAICCCDVTQRSWSDGGCGWTFWLRWLELNILMNFILLILSILYPNPDPLSKFEVCTVYMLMKFPSSSPA